MRRGGTIKIMAGLFVSALILAACGGDGEVEQETGPVTLQVMNFANYMPEDIGERFKAATGHDIELTLTSSNEDAIAKLDGAAEGTYDIVFVTSPFAEGLINAERFEPLDHEQIPNLSNLYPEASELDYDSGNEFTVPYSWGTTGFCYRTDLVTETEMDSWNDLLQPSDELVGKVTMLDEDRWILLPALKVLGYSANTTVEAELQEAADLSIQAKGSLLGYDAETFYTKLDSGEASAVMGWDGWCNYVSDPSVVEWVLPSEGSDLWVDVMAIPKGSTRLAAAHEFINFILEEENGLWVAENILYKVPNAAAMDALDPSYFETYPNMAITPAELLGQEALRDLGDGQTVFTEAVTQVKAA